MKLPVISGATEINLGGVSCTGTACKAVGSYKPSGVSQKRPLAEQWNGTEWAVQTTPLPEGATAAAFNDVSCFGNNCWAVGSYTSASGKRPFSERFDSPPFGTSIWEIDISKYIETPGTTEDELNSVSCWSTWRCMTVESYINASGGYSRSQYAVRQ